ncbi:MAG: zinc-dependent metalloprotease [candidate division WOR-3 bacterium]
MKRIILFFILLSNCLYIHHYQHFPKIEEKKEIKEKGPFKPWDEVLKDTKIEEGFLKIYIKRDNTLYLELSPSDFEKDFGLIMHLSYGLGDLNIIEGLPLSDTRLLRFRRIGDKVYLIHRNVRFRAEREEFKHFLEENVGHSVLASFKIESENEKTKNVLINITDFLVSDYPDLSRYLKYYYGNKPLRFDKNNSTVYKLKNFPENTEIDVLLNYETSDTPIYGGEGISDYRYLTIGVRFSFYKLPEKPMRIRLADERMGYFLEAFMDFDREKEESPFLRIINRWRLEKKDNSQEISEPVKPIVFYLDKSIPQEYKKYVKEGILAWNEAFEKAGFKDAIVVKDAPDDPNWDPEDIRYSTVRWISAREMGYAIGPSQVDPRTGEILNADILISSSFVRGWLFDYEELIEPLKNQKEIERFINTLPEDLRKRLCLYEYGLKQQIGFQYAVLKTLGIIKEDKEFPEKFIGDAIRELVMHEVGHTLGLRHNFKASSSTPFEKLNDTSFTHKYGLSLSVMDYNPVNISLDSKKQGDFWNKKVGEYDKWVIKYGYAPCYKQKEDGPFPMKGELIEDPVEEFKYLKKIARENTSPFYAYGTDEDASFYYGVDPLTSTWDLSDNLLKYAEERAFITKNVLPKLEDVLIQEDESYLRLRNAFVRVNYEKYIASLPLIKFIGGVHFNRFHKGYEKPPLDPVPPENQRKAISFLLQNFFLQNSFNFDENLLNKLAPNRWAHWGMWNSFYPTDFPVHDFVLFLQKSILEFLFYPERLKRVIDNVVRTKDKSPFTLSELFENVTNSIFEEVLKDEITIINSFRRNLQRAYVEKLGEVLLSEKYPSDAKSLSRYELTKVKDKIEKKIDKIEDLDTKAHLIEIKEKIKKILESSLTIEVKY